MSESESRPPVDTTNSASPPPPPYPPGGYPPPAPPKRGGVVSRLAVSLLTTVFILSIVMNLYLGLIYFSALKGGLSETEYQSGDSSKRIVIIPLKGLIDDATYSFYHDAFKELEKKKPAAIVIRVDSGGGYVSPSDRIWHELREFKTKHDIPVVASFGGVAASGAYYISATADVIVMEPTGLTGSIGVISQAFTFPGLMEKVGVTPETIVSEDSPMKDEFNPFRAWTDEDRGAMKVILANAYKSFFDVVYEGRKSVMTEDELKAVANGAVYTATQAKENHLIDEIGYLAKAIEVAKDKAGIAASDEPQVTVLSRPTKISLLNLLSSDVPDPTAVTPEQLRGWMLEMGTPRLSYHLGQ